MAETPAKSTVHELTVSGVTFTVDTDLLDDVKTLDLFDRIEDKGQVAAVMPLLKNVLGKRHMKSLKLTLPKWMPKNTLKSSQTIKTTTHVCEFKSCKMSTLRLLRNLTQKPSAH